MTFPLVQGRRETLQSPSLLLQFTVGLHTYIYTRSKTVTKCNDLAFSHSFPGHFPTPHSSLLFKNPKVGARQTLVNYCLTGRSLGRPPREGRTCGMGQDSGRAPKSSSHCLHHLVEPMATAELAVPQGQLEGTRGAPWAGSPKGDHGKGPADPQSRKMLVRLGASAFLASTSQTHSNISLFFFKFNVPYNSSVPKDNQ